MYRPEGVADSPDEYIPESWFREYWQYQEFNSQVLVTEDGRPVKVVYPGRPNDGRGADFRDAVIRTGDGLMTGDIEIHLKSADWRNHHHHLDSSYNRVILHVVLKHNSKTGTRLQNGAEVPVLALEKYITGRSVEEPVPGRTVSGIPCSGVASRHDTEKITGLLETAGEERFYRKADGFRNGAADYGSGEELYRGIMTALGYSGNKEAFLELASRLSLSELETGDIMTGEDCIICCQARLLGTAGFLSEDSRGRMKAAGIDEKLIKSLETAWQSMKRGKIMSPDAWCLFRIRPGNSPIRRILAMGIFLARYREKGLLNGLLEMVDGLPERGGPRRLEDNLTVISPESTFGNNNRKNISFLGKSRAADIAVNVLLPFVFTLGGDRAEKALSLYRGYPRLAENSLEKHMAAQFGLERKVINSARRQQGLIYIYKNLCTRGRCGECRLSQLETGIYVQRQTVRFTGCKTEIATGGYHSSVVGA